MKGRTSRIESILCQDHDFDSKAHSKRIRCELMSPAFSRWQLLLLENEESMYHVSGRLPKLANRKAHVYVSRTVLHASKLVHTAIILLRSGKLLKHS